MKALKLWNLIEQINLTDTSSKDAVDKPITFKGRHVNNNKFKHDFKIKNNKSVKVLLFWVLCIIKTQSSFGINISSLSGCTVDIQVTIAQNVSNPGCPQGVAIITPNTAENYAWEIIPTFNLSSNAGSSNGFYNQIGELVGTSLMAGDYIIEIETQSGCIGSQTFTISQPLCNIIPPNVTYTNPSVNGAFDGSIDFNFEAGNSCFGNWSYMLMWNGFALNFGDLGEPSSIPGMLNGEVNNLPAGNYELDINPGGLVLYPSACVGSTTFTITEPPCDMNFISTVTQITANSCSNAQISLAITGESRTGLYLVNITSPDNITTSYFATETDGAGSFSIGNLSPGNYFVRVLNNDDPYSSCDFSELLSITEPVCELTLSNFTATNSNSSGCGTGSASISISGNTCFDYYVAEVSLNGNPYSYYYITETDGSGVLSITSLPEGNYTLNVNNGAACTQSQNFTITEPACNLQMNNLVSTNISSTGCNDGTINVDLSGTTCSNYYIINIYHDAMIYGTYYASESSGAGQFNLSTLPVGNYQISVNNGSTSCQIDQTFEITEPACNIAIVNFAANNPTVNVGNNGSITFDAQGAVCNGFYYYEVYQNGNMYVSAYISVTGFSSTAFVNNLPEGNYELKLFSAYMSSCVASQSFTLSASPCNMSISNLTVNNLNSVGCTNGGISCNLSGSTVYGHYYVTLNKDGILFANYFVIPSGAQTAFNLSSLEVGNYEMILSDGYSDPCIATTNFNITQQACNIQINNPVIDQETTSQQTVVASVSGSISGASCDGSYLVNLIQTDGSVFASQTIPTTNPNFLFENVTAGIYSIKAYPGLVSESCIDQYDFILTDPCPVSNVSFVIDSTAGPCTFSTVHVTVSGATDPTKLYSVEYRLDGDSWGIAYGPYFGHPGVQTFDLYLSIDGYYEFRSGPLVVLPTCPVVSGLSIYKKYCDAFQTSTTVTNASNDCSNGVVNIYFNDPIKCLATFYTGKVFQAGVEVENLSFTPIAGNNYVASAQLLSGNYSYIIYTEGDIYGGGIGCPLTGTFSIGNEACNLSISNEVTENTCFGTNYAAQVNGTTCNGSYLVELYKDAMLVSSNTITEYSGIGFLSFSDLQTGSYELKVFSNALNPASCVAINNFDVNTASCNLAINNIVVTNAAADLSFNGSVNFNISGLECSGYQVTILKDGFAYFSNPITASGPVTPVTFTALPPDDYTIVLSNGACEVSTPFTVLQGNPTCNLQVNVTNESKPNSGCSNGSITINMQGNANGNNYSLAITKDGNSIFNANYSSLTAVTDIIPNLSSGNYVITLSYSGSGTCISTVNYNLGDLPCNLAITDVVTTQACDNYNNGAIAFDVNGTICQTSALQLLSNTGAILVNTTISQSEGKVFEDLFAANYSIQVTSPSGCSINYPFTIEPQCDLSLFNESITLEGAGNCTTAKLSYFVNANYCSASLVKLINNTDMTIFYQSNLPNQDGIDANEITNIPVGNYTLQVLNNSGNCSESYNFIVAPAPCSNIQFSNVTLGESSSGCAWAIGYDLNLGNCPGSMMTLAKEGNLVSTYFFNESVSTEINNLSSGNYNLHLTTGSGCVIDYPFAVNPVCNLAISNVITTQSCDASASGTISFNLTGNICLNTPLRLLDNSGLIINSQMIDEAGNYSFIDLIAGTYSIQLVNQAGCSLNYPFTIEPQCDLTLFNESITLEGAGNCTTAKLSYYVNASYCSASIVKLTNNIDMTVVYQSNIPNQDGIDANEITNIPVGNYTLQVLNNSGNCSASYNFIIAPAPCSNIQFSNVTLGESTSGCAWAFGYDLNLGNCPGSIMTLAKEGNLANTYFFNESVSTEINNLSAGMYNLHLTTGSGCIIDYPFEVSPVCDLAIANVTTTQSCDASASGTISFNLSGNICLNTPLRLLDNTGLIINTQMINEAGNYSFINLIAGNYSIQLVNQAGCSLNYPFTIEPQCDLSLFNESITLEGAGNCTTAKLSYFVNANYCSASLVKLINNTDMTIFYQSNLPNQDGIDANEITNIPVGNYTLQVLNSSGNCSATYNFVVVPAPCSNIQFTNVTINPSPIDGCYYNFGYDLNLGNCPGSVLTLNQNGSVLETYNLIGSVSTEITNLTTGNYNLHLSSAGCEMDYPFEVTPSLCNINIANAVVSSTGVLYCVNGRIDFDVTGTTCGTGAVALIQNGNILNTINWTTGNGAGLHFENLSPGNYSIVAVNNLFNVTCGDTLYFTVNSVQPPLSISNVSVNSTGVLACTSGNVSFAVNGQFCSNSFVIVFNESNTIVFSAPYNNGGNQIYNVSGLAPGNYTIEFGLVGYSITETFTVNPNPCNLAITNLQINTIAGSDNCTIANVTFTPTGDMCSNGFIQLMQNGSLIGASILWNQNTAPNISFDNLTPGIYTVFIATYFPNICSTSIDFEVLPTPCNLSIANISFTPSNGSNGTIDVTGVGAYCGNIAIALDAEISPANYSNLSTNYGNLITQFSNLSPGNYRVTISSSGSSCLDVEYITVTAATCNTNPIISASNTNICPGQTIILNSNYLTGNAWSNGGTSFNTQVTTSGTYTLTVTELNGCTGTTSITITNASNCVPATQMNNGVCGTINFVRTSSITCIAVAGATQYEWQFSNSNGVYATKTTTTNYVLLHGVSPTLNWGTNWNIKVRAKIGTNVGPYSPDCNIGIMPDPSINGVPQTQLRSQDCNKLNYRMNADNRIIANPVAGAIQYEFEFSSAVTGLVVATKLMTNNVLYLNTVTPSLTFPAQYNVRVRARIASTWAVFGTPCLIGIIGLNRDEDNNTEELEKINIQSTYDDYFDMTVMPNPFNEQAILRINSGSVEQINVEVFDMVGNIVWKNNVLSNNNLTFGVELAQGTYIVKAMNQKGNQAMFRFIKSK